MGRTHKKPLQRVRLALRPDVLARIDSLALRVGCCRNTILQVLLDAGSAAASVERISDGQLLLPGLEGNGPLALVSVGATKMRIAEDRMSFGPERQARKDAGTRRRGDAGKKRQPAGTRALGL